MPLNRSQLIAIITGLISLLLGIAYLSLAQLLDYRGELLPAPEGCLWPVLTLMRLFTSGFVGTELSV